MNTVLAIEDSPEAYRLIQLALNSLVQLHWAKSVSEASALLSKNKYDLILLDGSLPDGDGFQLCSMLQTHEDFAQIPIVLLTARNTIMDKVMGFSVGADDFIMKPFEPLELRARIESKLRKRHQQVGLTKLVVCGDFEIDTSAQRAFIRDNGVAQELDLTPIEFKLLLLFVTKPDIVHSRDKILDTVWGSNINVYARSVDTHISKLRKKLGSRQDLITSAHGSGYRMEKPTTNVSLNALEESTELPRKK